MCKCSNYYRWRHKRDWANGSIIEYGADKISINSIVYSNPKIIDESSKKFGSQAITVSIDVKKLTIHIDVFHIMEKN